MKHFKEHYFSYLLLMSITLSLGSCATKKKTIVVNKEVVSKKHNYNKSAKNILYIVDGKEVDETFIKTISTDKIESVTVIKDKKEVIKYTDKEYEGIIIIKMKKLYKK